MSANGIAAANHDTVGGALRHVGRSRGAVRRLSRERFRTWDVSSGESIGHVRYRFLFCACFCRQDTRSASAPSPKTLLGAESFSRLFASFSRLFASFFARHAQRVADLELVDLGDADAADARPARRNNQSERADMCLHALALPWEHPRRGFVIVHGDRN